jgi:hypothetical protein
MGVTAAPIARALSSFSSDMMRVSDTMHRKDMRDEEFQRQQMHAQNVRWANESNSQLRREISDFMNDGANNSQEDFELRLQKFMDAKMVEYQANSANQDSTDMLNAKLLPHMDAKYDEAANIAARNRLERQQVSIEKQTQDTLATFRNEIQREGSGAVQNLTWGLENIKVGIKESFGEIAPRFANKMIASVMHQAIIETSVTQPDLARSLLEATPEIDADVRKALTKEIDSRENARDAMEFQSFKTHRRNMISNANMHGVGEKIPLDEYKLYYPVDQAKAQKSIDDSLIDTAVKAKTMFDTVKDLNMASQIAAMEALQPNIRTEEDKNAFALATASIQRELEVQQEDPARWVSNHNEEVKSYDMMMSLGGTEDEQTLLRGKRADAILLYQGPPHAGATPEERANFLSRPLNDRHLLSLNEATEFAARINGSSPNEVLGVFTDMAEQYPDEQHQLRILNDMVTLPSSGKGISPAYQLVLQNKDAWWIDTYVAALQQREATKKLSLETTRDIAKTLERNPVWNEFARALIGDSNQRADEVLAFREGVEAYAQAMIIGNGTPPEQAINMSVKRLVNESLGFVMINGAPLAISRERENEGMPPRTDEELEDIQRRTELSLAFIDPRRIDWQKHLPSVAQLQDPIKQMQAVRDKVTRDGFMRTTFDGQGMVLYMLDDNGFPFQVTDIEDGSAFTIMVDDIPEDLAVHEFSRRHSPYTYMLSDRAAIYKRRIENAKDTYPLRSMGKDGRTTTNWPVAVDWIK